MTSPLPFRPLRRFLLLSLVMLASVALALWLAPAHRSTLAAVQARGALVVATYPSLTTVYRAPGGPSGMEYELARGFADRLGVRLRLLKLDNPAAAKAAVRAGRADLAAAGLMIPRHPSSDLRFTTAYQKVAVLVLYRLGQARPQSLDDLAGQTLAVRAGSPPAQRLAGARQPHPDLNLLPVPNADAERLLGLVERGEADHALITSNAYAIHRTLFPDVAAGFAITEQRGLGWAFARQADGSLYLAAQRYLTQAKAGGQTARLVERFYGHQDHFNRYAARHFLQHLDDRLPRYTGHFRAAARKSGFDWRLLAAMAYQESRWNADAVSPTGVEGLMMLTTRTARAMGISDRTDPAQSIRAGAAYLRLLHDRLPKRIPEPDRTWMALAAYNAGPGRLEAARVRTDRQGADPDRWAAVRQRLRQGPPSGSQAAAYVHHIRRYYDLLVWAGNSRRHAQTLLVSAE